MARLLVVHHVPSPSVHAMFESVRDGTRAEGIEGVEIITSAALSTTADDVLHADGYVLITPANLGTMSGALKHFFDTIYYPCLEQTRGRPFGVAVHGNNDVDGALADIDKIVTGLGWTRAADHVRVIDRPDRDALDACWNLGATIAALVMDSIQEILDRADELAGRFEDYEAAGGDERSLEEYLLERATLDRARSERQVVEAVTAARGKGLSWQRIGAVLGTSAQAAQQRHGAVVESG